MIVGSSSGSSSSGGGGGGVVGGVVGGHNIVVFGRAMAGLGWQPMRRRCGEGCVDDDEDHGNRGGGEGEADRRGEAVGGVGRGGGEGRRGGL